MVLDKLAEKWGIRAWKSGFKGLSVLSRFETEQILLLKPETYMNRSGDAVQAASNFYKLDLSDIMVVVDDIALPIGAIRIRKSGSSGGHKGLSSVASRLGSEEYPRLRVGIGRSPAGQAVSHVLGKVSREEATVLSEAVQSAAQAVEVWVREGIDVAMNRYNRKITEMESENNDD
jgi:PTH1 family peptidyl-tRNA hydrolase